MTNKAFPFVILPLSEEDGGGFQARALDLYGCMADGETPEEAAENIADAIAEWCDEMRSLGREVPEPGSAIAAAEQRQRAMEELIQKQDRLLSETLASIAEDVADLAQEIEQLRRMIVAALPEDDWRGRSVALAAARPMAELCKAPHH